MFAKYIVDHFIIHGGDTGQAFLQTFDVAGDEQELEDFCSLAFEVAVPLAVLGDHEAAFVPDADEVASAHDDVDVVVVLSDARERWMV